jgi:hypothetical protein
VISLQQTVKSNIRDLYRGINYFKKDYQPRSNLVKDENGDLRNVTAHFGHIPYESFYSLTAP